MLVHADTAFLRLGINRLKKTRGHQEMAVGYVSGQLAVTWDGVEYHVPAYGHWFGSCTLLASTFIAALPGRLPARSTPMAFANRMLSLAYRIMSASWVEA
jgi:hypothetical protein